jgi:hypothetical protein
MTIDSMMAVNVNLRLKDTPGGGNVSDPGEVLSINGFGEEYNPDISR